MLCMLMGFFAFTHANIKQLIGILQGKSNLWHPSFFQGIEKSYLVPGHMGQYF